MSPKSGRGLGHVTSTIFGSTVGYPSDSLASCLVRIQPSVNIVFKVLVFLIILVLVLSYSKLKGIILIHAFVIVIVI